MYHIVGEIRNAGNILIESPWRKRPLERSRCRWEEKNLKVDYCVHKNPWHRECFLIF